MAQPTAPARYPSGGDYVDALQHPATAFTDAQLRTGVVRADPLGLPQPVSGNFASVFQVTATDGRRWAVKCFTRPVGDQHRRYHAISAALRALPHEALVDFTYLPTGIIVQGRPYPLLKMRWVDAEGLMPWLETNRGDSARVRGLADQLVDIVNTLEQAGIAHGDLQHGNLLVTATDQLVLIDYDGMYVPALRGLPPAEKGLANYQHPLRGDHDFGPGLDRFAGWVIYTSLRALAHEPQLWRTLRAADDDTKLLLDATDYTDPGASAALAKLRSTGHQPLTALVDSLTTFARMGLGQIPKLDPTAVTGTVAAVVPAQRPPAEPPEWLADHLEAGTPPAPPRPTPPPLVAPRFTPGRHLTIARIAALTIVAVIAWVIAGIAGVAAIPTVVLAACAGITLLGLAAVAGAYRSHPTAAARGEARRLLHDRRAATDQAQAAHGAVQEEISRLRAQHERQRQASLDQRTAAAHARQQTESKASQDLNAALRQLDSQRNNPANSLAAREAAALADLCRQHVHDRLRTTVIAANPPQGISRVVAGHLAAKGFRTAADVVTCRVVANGGRGETAYLVGPAGGRGVHVEQVGPARARSLVEWRTKIQSNAQRTAPTRLPADHRRYVQQQYEQHLKNLAQRETSARQVARSACAAAVARERQTLLELDQAQTQRDVDFRAAHGNLTRRLAGAARDVATAERAQQRQQDALTAFDAITFRAFLHAAAGRAAP